VWSLVRVVFCYVWAKVLEFFDKRFFGDVGAEGACVEVCGSDDVDGVFGADV